MLSKFGANPSISFDKNKSFNNDEDDDHDHDYDDDKAFICHFLDMAQSA